ncbi:hypothetical protein SAMN00120144_1305 [Hymenobacter roseosalivarius DSM 11622]|uniref:DUF5777 domain-containing protein n=1 Tax=Hymenobacter roseosalivarius DSM 11622 TaxID=645990 RepID=A0A1W1W589_9BACT|nr:DUF5777 family beta-barrel protein [Hymenobacter roseosalivarius]SMC00551.1 hypothetical protein SAMN00120144_1305 [Hymenobacter roseosalivarius DSM 11622]
MMASAIFTAALLLGLALSAPLRAQTTPAAPAPPEDLEQLLDEAEVPRRQLVTGTFKGSRIINLQSVEQVQPGTLEFLISHRFGTLDSGAYQLWGLDQSTIRIGLQYGITRFLAVGVGRSSFQKAYDGFAKASLLRQSTGGAGSAPVSVSYFSSVAVNTLKFEDPTRRNYFSSRLVYVNQLLVARKFNERLSLQIAPTVVHRNLVATEQDANIVYAVGVGGRLKLTKRTSLNAEYIYRVPPRYPQAASYAMFYNSLSVGFDIETGGHVFQFHLSNSLSMIEKGFVTETTDSWANGGIHLGFNISRDFNFHPRPR